MSVWGKGGVIKRARKGGNVQISDRRETHPLTDCMIHRHWLTQGLTALFDSWKAHADMHTNSTEAWHTWKAHTVQTREEASLFCHRHANLQVGRNMLMELYCPLYLSLLLISLRWHIVRHKDAKRLQSITLSHNSRHSLCFCVGHWDRGCEGRENMRRQTTVGSS